VKRHFKSIVALTIAVIALVAAYLWWQQERRDRAQRAFARAIARTDANRVRDAEVALHSVGDARLLDVNRYAALLHAIEQRRTGAYPLIVDRSSRTIGTYDIASRQLSATPGFEPIVKREAGALTFEANITTPNETLETTLDHDVQLAALAALGNYRGSLVAIDPRTNEILAIVSSRGKGPLANLALEQQYEPGSIVKTLTGLNGYSTGVMLPFPYHCTGALTIDGRRFGDWIPTGHGDLPSLDEAYAESCNIVFADLGLHLGADRVRSFMARAGFDGETNLGIFRAPLGKFVGAAASNYELASMSIGLERESVNALHVAMLASMMANRGALTTPRLVRARRAITGEALPGGPARGTVQLAPREAAEKMISAMRAVVTSEKGTGHRAAIDGLTIAMKTGTSGSRAGGGLECVILAFAPADQPKIAFGMIAEDAGPAEFAGAKIAHDFLMALRPRL
jgi:cell division protein FtsI/penicillin-binding protein 2